MKEYRGITDEDAVHFAGRLNELTANGWTVTVVKTSQRHNITYLEALLERTKQ